MVGESESSMPWPMHRRSSLPSRRLYATSPATRAASKAHEFRVVPFVVLFACATGAYVFLVKKRAAEPRQVTSAEAKQAGR
ncbi:hypothetical protein DV737_g5072, partial [Chaetothyriales sp. CBS 132003]